MDLGNWLRNQGLERFEAAFRDNGIDQSVLPHLTHDHLRELGLPLGAPDQAARGHCRAFKGNRDTTSQGTTTVANSPADVAERRQITVLFSDLVGSTALSTRMDAEDLQKLISAYQKCVTETVRRFGGFVAKYMGDGVLVYFGYPEAHEDDAERAVRSGLDLVAEVAKLKTGMPLQARVGIATGSGRGRRSRRIGTSTGAGHYWRDAEPCGASAGTCRTQHGSPCSKHPKALGQLIRVAGPWHQGTQGNCWPSAHLGSFAKGFCRGTV